MAAHQRGRHLLRRERATRAKARSPNSVAKLRLCPAQTLEELSCAHPIPTPQLSRQRGILLTPEKYVLWTLGKKSRRQLCIPFGRRYRCEGLGATGVRKNDRKSFRPQARDIAEAAAHQTLQAGHAILLRRRVRR